MQNLEKMLKDINDFHEKYVPDLTPDGHTQLDGHTADFRIGFMQEELDEYRTAYEADDLEGQLDALVDLVYVALGTSWLQGLPFGEAWDEVQAANMRKVRARSADESKRGSVYDVVKPDGWIGPDITAVLNKDADNAKT